MKRAIAAIMVMSKRTALNIDIDNRLAPDGFQLDEANGMLLKNIGPEN
jgi:hypothetical protein